MHKSRIRKLYSFSFIILFVLECQSTPISTNLKQGYNYKSETFYLDLNMSNTIQGEEGTGMSPRLYTGIIEDFDTASIILRIDADSLIETNLCLSDSITKVELILTSITQLGTQLDSMIIDTLFDYNNFSISLIQNQVNWNELDPVDIYDIQSIKSSSELELLAYDFSDYNIKIKFADIDMFYNEICVNENNLEILLEYLPSLEIMNNPLSFIEFRSSDHSIGAVSPKLNTDYFIDYDSLFTYNKYSIISTENIQNSSYNTYYVGLDSINEWGDFYLFNIEGDNSTNLIEPFILDSIDFSEDIIDSIDLYKDLILFNINIELNHEIIDSINSIKFNILDFEAYLSEIDPMGDNWYNGLNKDSLTENNLQYDIGELFYDYGFDNCPDSLELGDQENCVLEPSLSIYNPNGTEGNGILDWIDLNSDGLWNPSDYGEEWKDVGTDGCSDEFETGQEDDKCSETQIEDFNLGDDPNGDNYNIDPNNDNFESLENPLGTENNAVWDQNESFLDFGSDGLPASIVGYYDLDGTEGNGIWNIGEPYDDFGIDGIPDSLELGYNDLGTENNNQWDGENEFNDCGVDNLCDIDGDSEEDNFVIDPNLDNWSEIDTNLTQAPNGNIVEYIPQLDWTDFNENGIWDSGEGERWFDWGIDKILDRNEIFIDSFVVIQEINEIYYEIDLDNENEVVFDSPNINDAKINFWISKIQKITSTSVNLEISINSEVQLKGLTFHLNHEKFNNNKIITIFKEESISEINSEKIFQDITLLPMENVSQLELDSTLQINYFNNLYSKLSFQNLDEFLTEQEGLIFSPEYTNLIIYPDKDSSLIDLDGMWIYISRLSVDENNMLSLDKIFSNQDSIVFPMAQILQQYESGQFNQFDGLYFSTDGVENNFSNLRIGLSKLPRIEVFFSQ